MRLQKTIFGDENFQKSSSKSLLTEPKECTCVMSYEESPLLDTSISTGFTPKNSLEIISHTNTCNIDNNRKFNLNSIIDILETGFGEVNTLVSTCKKPKYKIPLYKEGFLSEFNSESEKQKVRDNLEIYSKPEVDKIVSKIIASDLGTFITKLEVEQLIKNLDFVDSSLKALVSYDIPNNLFKL